jgi:septal ring factor EnvC (AmiA/AmiB activator)
MSELQALALEHLKEVRRDIANHRNALAQQQFGQSQTIKQQAEAIKTLEARQNESEKTLRHLSELYNRLLPLIESINSDIRNRPR